MSTSIYPEMRERLVWLMRFKHDPSFLGPLVDRVFEIRGMKDLRECVRKQINPQDPKFPSDSQWGKYLTGAQSVPAAVRQALSVIYHGIPDEFFQASNDVWHEKARALESTKDALSYGTDLVEKERNSVAKYAKVRYREVDECPQLPLIAKSAWIFDEPKELTQADNDQEIYSNIPDAITEDGTAIVGGYSMLKRYRADPEIAKRMHNGLTFRVMEIARNENGGLRLLFAPGKYYNFLDTCEVRGATLALEMLRGEPANLVLPSSNRISSGDIFRFWTRSAPLGVNCLTILKNYTPRQNSLAFGNYFLMHYRGMNVIEAQNVWHVVPAGGHGPSKPTSGGVDRSAIWWTVVREFLEECFNKKELQDFRTDGGDFFDQPEVVPYLRGIFETPGVANIFFFGVGIDPVNQKPEALVAIVVDWQKAEREVKKRLRSDKPFKLKIDENYEGKIEERALLGAEDLVEAGTSRDKVQVQPAGTACLFLAARSFSTLINSV